MVKEYNKPKRNVSAGYFTWAAPCHWCERPAKRDTVAHYSTDEDYDGNYVVVKTSKFTFPDGRTEYTRYLWDGLTYTHRYGHFCSQPCGMHYAEARIRADGRSTND